MEAEYTRSVKQSILDYVLLDPAEQRRLGLDMPQPVSIMHGSIWSVTMPPRVYPREFASFFFPGGIFPTLGHAGDNSLPPNSWSTSYTIF